jgi:hypothetical protein
VVRCWSSALNIPLIVCRWLFLNGSLRELDPIHSENVEYTYAATLTELDFKYISEIYPKLIVHILTWICGCNFPAHFSSNRELGSTLDYSSLQLTWRLCFPDLSNSPNFSKCTLTEAMAEPSYPSATFTLTMGLSFHSDRVATLILIQSLAECGDPTNLTLRFPPWRPITQGNGVVRLTDPGNSFSRSCGVNLTRWSHLQKCGHNLPSLNWRQDFQISFWGHREWAFGHETEKSHPF